MVKVCIGVISSDYIRAKTVSTLISLVKNTPYISQVVIKQGCLLHKNREDVVLEALKGDYTHLFFIDSDMCFSSQVLRRLLARDKDIVGGLYYHRHLPKKSVVAMEVDGKPVNFSEIPKDLFKCFGCGTGCMLIKMSVFKRMKRPWFFFEPCTGNEDGLGEDLWFCKRAGEAGIETWCDPTVEIGHIGEQIF